MTRKAIEIFPWPASMPTAGEYNAANYPKSGIYFHSTNESLAYLVFGGTVFALARPQGMNSLLIDLPDEIGEAIQAVPVGDRGGMSENNILKLVAIIGKPELAEKLCL